MSKKHDKQQANAPVYSPSLQEETKPSLPEEAPKPVQSWVVLEDRTVAISGTITKVRTGKVIKDKLIAERLTEQGVKLEAR